MSDREHYFTAEPASRAQQRELTVRLAGRTVTVQTAAGVFCPDRIDQGTEVLLRHVPAPPAQGNVLDLGCGWGPIALTLGLLAPRAQVWAVDVNERALALVRDNAVRLEIPRLTAAAPDEVPGEAAFATIWSNPPIRVGKAVLHALLGQWLPRLEAGAAAYLVVQKNLGSDSLQRWLCGELDPSRYAVSRFVAERGFRVLEVQRRPLAGATPRV